MFRRVSLFTLALVFLSAPVLWAQHGAWEGCTLKNMKARYTDRQVGGYLLHQSATLVREVSRVLPRVRTPEQRRILGNILARVSQDIERISLIMKEGRLTQKDMDAFQREMERAKREIKGIAP